MPNTLNHLSMHSFPIYLFLLVNCCFKYVPVLQYVRYFSHCYDKDKLRKEGSMWLIVSGYRSSWWRRHGGRIMIYPSGIRERLLLVLSSLPNLGLFEPRTSSQVRMTIRTSARVVCFLNLFGNKLMDCPDVSVLGDSKPSGSDNEDWASQFAYIFVQNFESSLEALTMS